MEREGGIGVFTPVKPSEQAIMVSDVHARTSHQPSLSLPDDLKHNIKPT